MKLYKVSNVKYDWTDGEATKEDKQSVPRTFYVITDIPDEIANIISDETGWLIQDLTIKEIDKAPILFKCFESV